MFESSYFTENIKLYIIFRHTEDRISIFLYVKKLAQMQGIVKHIQYIWDEI